MKSIKSNQIKSNQIKSNQSLRDILSTPSQPLGDLIKLRKICDLTTCERRLRSQENFLETIKNCLKKYFDFYEQ